MHKKPHPLAGCKVTLNNNVALDPRKKIAPGEVFRVKDWVDRMGKPWKEQENWATKHYAVRQALSSLPNSVLVLPDDDEVVYGHIGTLGHCVHDSELGIEV